MARFAVRSFAALVASTSVLLSLGSGARAEPDAGIHLENLVPERTLAFLSLENVGSWGAKSKETAIAKMVADPEMAAFVKPIMEDLEKMRKSGGSAGGPMMFPPMFFKVAEQLQGLSGQVAIALVDWADQHGPVVAASLDFGTHLQDFVTFLKGMAADAGKDGPPITSEEKDGRTWWTIGGGRGPTITATSVGTAIFLSTDATWLQAAVSSNGAAVPSNLGSAAAFKASKKSAGGDGLLVFLHANVPAILAKVNLHGDGKRVADALGADTVRSFAYGIGFKGDGYVESIVIDAPKADHGLIPLMVTKPVSHTALEAAPSTAFYFAESSMNLSTLVPKVRAIVEKIDAEALQQVDRVLSKARETLGVDVEKELLAGLADEMSFYAAVPETGGLYPEVSVSMKVKDPAAYEALVEKAVNGIAGSVSESERTTVSQRTLEYHGKRLHVVDLASKRRDMVLFTPTWAILGDRLVVTLVPHAMKEIVLRAELGNPSGGLAAQEDVKSLLRTAPEGSSGWVYLDLQAAINLLYDTGVPLLQTLAKQNLMKNTPVRFDWAQLPPARVMRPYFRSMGEFVVADDSGLRIEIRGMLPMMLPMIAMSAVMPMMMMRRRSSVDFGPVEMPPHEAGGADFAMLEVNAAVRLYFSDNGKLPTTLDDLTKPNPKTDRPYLDKLPKDRWGHDFGYDKTGDGGDDYSVKSAGSDGVFGTADDVVFPRRMR